MKQPKKPLGRKKLPDEDKLHPWSLKISNHQRRDIKNISEQTGDSEQSVAREAMGMGINLIYENGEVKPLVG